jgi:hypothetical protein
MSKPDEQVADRIIEQLRKQKLLLDVTLAKLKPKLAAGSLYAEDWRLTAETDTTDKKKRTDDEDH